MSYTLHPSEKLVTLLRERPWQGYTPVEAKFLFIGLDANYAADIQDSLPEVFDYLHDGVDFWERTGVHHPFRLHQYKGSGKKYHDKFAEIGFNMTHANRVSFVELLHLPTTGVSKLVLDDLSQEHLKKLRVIIERGSARYIFAPASVISLMRQSKLFPWLPRKPARMDNALGVLRETTGQTIYQIYHLSCFGWQLAVLNRQIAQLRKIVAYF